MSNQTPRAFLAQALLLVCAAAPLAAQAPYEYWPGAKYNPAIPTIKSVLGYEPGERITSHAGLMTYLEALAKASPRIKIIPYDKFPIVYVGGDPTLQKQTAKDIARLAKEWEVDAIITGNGG